MSLSQKFKFGLISEKSMNIIYYMSRVRGKNHVVTSWVPQKQTFRLSLGCWMFIKNQHLWKEEKQDWAEAELQCRPKKTLADQQGTPSVIIHQRKLGLYSSPCSVARCRQLWEGCEPGQGGYKKNGWQRPSAACMPLARV